MKQIRSKMIDLSAIEPVQPRADFPPYRAPSGRLSLTGIEIWSAEEGLIHQFGTQDHITPPALGLCARDTLDPQDYFRAGLRLGADTLWLRDVTTGQQLSLADRKVSTDQTFLQGPPPALALLRDHITRSLLSMPTAHCTGIAGGTSIMTPQGYADVEQMRPGQHVLTKDAGTRVILGIARCEMSRLTQLSLPQFAPIYFPPSSVGVQNETCLAPDHPVCVSGPAVYYEFGEQEVYLHAKEYISQARSYQQSTPADLTYYHVVLDQPAIMRTEAHWIDSLNTCDVAPEWFADMFEKGQLKTVPNMPLEMLQQPAPERRHLRRFEAQTLLAEMSRNF